MRIYLQRTSASRRSQRLLLTYGGRTPGSALSTQRLSHWLVDGIALAYTTMGKPVPRLKAHSTRGTSTLIAVLAGIDWEEVRQVAVWHGDLTFMKHYCHHINVRSVTDAVLEQA